MKSSLSKNEKAEWMKLLTEYCKYINGKRSSKPKKFEMLDEWYKKYVDLMNEKLKILMS